MTKQNENYCHCVRPSIVFIFGTQTFVGHNFIYPFITPPHSGRTYVLQARCGVSPPSGQTTQTRTPSPCEACLPAAHYAGTQTSGSRAPAPGSLMSAALGKKQ